MIIRQGFRFRLREHGPDARQFRRYVGSCRFVWNKALAHQLEMRQTTGKMPGHSALCALLPEWKKELPWLAEVPSQTLQQTLNDLMQAWARFFENLKKGYRVAPDNYHVRKALRKSGVKLAFPPRFKRYGKKEGMRFPQGFKIDEAHARVWLPKLGWIRYRQSRLIEGTPKNVTVSLSAGSWYVAIQTEREGQIPSSATRIGGGDRGVTDFIAIADEHSCRTVSPLNAGKAAMTRLARYQRSCARKIEAVKVRAGLPKDKPFPKGFRFRSSNRLRRAQARVAKLHGKIAQTRKDWLHKLSTGIAQDYAVFCLEDLKVTNMTASAKGTKDAPGKKVRQKAGLNRSILDQGWGMFKTQLKYKLEWRGGQVILVPPQYTSQKCSACGYTHPDNRDGKHFKCLCCGKALDADVNAALNILAAGHAVLAGEGAGDAGAEDSVLSGRPSKRQSARTEGGSP